MSKTRFAVIAVNAECCGQRCVVFARRTDGKNKELSLADILAACVTGCASDDVEALIKDWSLGDTLKEIAREFGFQNKAVCAVGLDLI
jgi:hypothetical protein